VATEPADDLVLDLLEWLEAGDQSYADTMERWRTSCPRLDVWERATAAGLVASSMSEHRGLRVAVTPLGRQRLQGARAR
jgi:hypothetical protein